MSAPTPEKPASDDTAGERPGGLLREWVLPIVFGLAIGAGIVWVWRHGGELLRSDAEKVVARWSPDDFEENDRLAEELKKLGKDARADLLQAFRGIEVPANPDSEDEWKFWTAMSLAGDPFFDTRSLLEIARDASSPKWDRRCAAAALVHTLRKDVDPTAVVEPLLEWLEDPTIFNHILAMTSVRQLRSDSIFPPDQEARLRKALLGLTESGSRPKPPDEYDQVRLRTDRERAVRSLASFITEDDVKARIWAIAQDESDDVHLRAAAIQTLAVSRQFDDVEPWKKVAASPDVIVRQTVADNLVLTPDPAYDQILAPMHADAGPLVRKGSLETQAHRNRATMLAPDLMGCLVEDHDSFVRFEALVACGVFKSHLDGMGARQGMALRLLETSDDDEDVAGAILALHMMTGQSFGFEPGDLDVQNRSVRDTAVAAFKADRDGRKMAVEKWRAHLGGTAVWTDSDRRAALERLLKHADPENVRRATEELAKLGK
jgi:hypothetical protein